MTLIIITSYYLSILISIIGFGYFSARILNINIFSKDLMLFGFLGIIILTFLSYFTNLFVAHNFIHNIFLLLVGLIFFLYGCVKKDIDKISSYKIILLATVLLSLSLLSKTHDDFGWYHLPYTLNLSENKLQFGLGHFNHGFRTPSSLFYLNSLFYLPVIKFYSFNFGQLYIFLFSLIFFYKKIFNNFDKNILTFFYSLLAFIFVSVVFYRLAEHGTDRSGQAIIFITIIFILEILKDKTIDLRKINFLIIFLIYAITIKTYFVIFALLFLPIILKIKMDLALYKKIFFSKIILFSLIFLFMHFNIHIANTGCLFYPMNFTCYSNFTWSINTDEIILMQEFYELWAKSGANPNFKIENPTAYIKDFNWVSRWVSEYFFTKVSDLIFGIILISLICFFTFRNKSKKYIHRNTRELKVLLISISIISIIWFTKFPQLRYGGYITIANIFFIPLCIYIFNYNLNKKIINGAKVIITISLIIFSGRNINRIVYEMNFYQYKPLENAYFYIEEPKYEKKILSDGVILNKTNGACWSIPQPCARSPVLNGVKKKNYVIYWKD